MKHYWTLIFWFILSTQNAFAGNFSTEKIGVGLGSGTTTNAITAKKYMQSSIAVQVFIGTQGTFSHQAFSLGLDGVMEYPWQEIDVGSLFYGWGAGCGIYSYSGFGFQSSSIGFSGVIEAGLHWKEFPLELIIDLRPTLFLGTIADFVLFGGSGAIRWYF